MYADQMDQFTKESEGRNDNHGLKVDWGSNVHYGAHACENYATYCENRGVRNPRHCNECLCPLGYGGRFYTERPQSVNSKCQGKTVTATQTYQNLTITLGKEGKDEQEEFEQCFFWIESPSNTQLEVRVAGLNGTLTGRRLCSTKFVGRTWVSKANRTVVIEYSNKRLTTELQYRFVESFAVSLS
ncbi:hypothetical protein Q1695_014209 [Nippostrongylus brasiliensis]|nr:hypothetical protein Q1695_014209 [Nippostrongylus brasiliensis]